MLYYPISNYDEFRSLFRGNHGITNKTVLRVWLDKEQLKRRVRGKWNFINCLNNKQLHRKAREVAINTMQGDANIVRVNGLMLPCFLYRTDVYEGLCQDMDASCIRVIKESRVVKVKAGRVYRNFLDTCEHTNVLPAPVKDALCEEFSLEWKAYASEQVHGNLTLHVERSADAFNKIYDMDNYVQSFGSCMQNKGYEQFYFTHLDASAAWLENEDGKIVARCVVFNDVSDDFGRKHRLAERQYACNEIFKHILVNRLVSGKHIDGYKSVGAGCSDTTMFVLNDGTDLSDCTLTIYTEEIEHGTSVPYMDSFRYYGGGNELRNYCLWTYCFDCTDGGPLAERTVWSYYTQEEINEDNAVWVESRGDYIHQSYCVWCRNTSTDECEDDVVYINGAYYYAGRNRCGYDDVDICPFCDEWMCLDNAYYSDLTEEYYCCKTCMERAEEDYAEENGYVRDAIDGSWYCKDDMVECIDRWEDVCYVTKEYYERYPSEFKEHDGNIYHDVNEKFELINN